MQDEICSKAVAETLCTLNEKIESRYDSLTASKKVVREYLVEPVIGALGWDVWDGGQVRLESIPCEGVGSDETCNLFIRGKQYVRIIIRSLGSLDDCKGSALHVNVETDGRTWIIMDADGCQKIRIDEEGAGEKLCRCLSVYAFDPDARGPKPRSFNELVNAFKNEKGRYADEDDSRSCTNKAMRIFSEFVIENREKFQDEDTFVELMRAYLNILLHVSGDKTELPHILDSFEGLESSTKHHILNLSRNGKFDGTTRLLFLTYDADYRREFLDLVEAFMSNEKFEDLFKKLDTFVDETKSNGKRAFVTQIFSALQPEYFMPYNKRSVYPLSDTAEYKYLVDGKMTHYRKFNDLYERIGNETGMNFVELDVIANNMWWESGTY